MFILKEYKNYIFKFFISQRRYKKYRVDIYTKNNKFVKSVHFGDKRYQHYEDKIGLYGDLDHNDMERLQLYYKRHKKNYPEFSADFFSKKYLW
jgi:hypothetical protein